MDPVTVERCAKGDSAAWAALMPLHERRVFYMCYRFTKDSGDAQDLTQEVFLRVFRTVKSFRAGGGNTALAFRTWMARLTRNLLIDNYRRKRLDRLMEELEPRLARMKEKPAGSLGPDGIIATRQLRTRLDSEMRRLRPELRQTLVLREFECMEYSQISKALGVPEGTVKSRLNRARAELKPAKKCVDKLVGYRYNGIRLCKRIFQSFCLSRRPFFTS